MASTPDPPVAPIVEDETPPPAPSTASRWKKREDKLLDHVHGNMQWMMHIGHVNRIRSHYLGYASLILAVLAPLFAVTSTQGKTPFGLPDNYLSIVSAVITVLFSLTEGIRRIGRFEQVWHTMDVVMLELRSVREVFRDVMIEEELGSQTRIDALKSFRKEVDRVVATAVLAAHKISSDKSASGS